MRTIQHLSREEVWKLLSKDFPDPHNVTAVEFLDYLYANSFEVCKEATIFSAFNLRRNR